MVSHFTVSILKMINIFLYHSKKMLENVPRKLFLEKVKSLKKTLQLQEQAQD